MKIVLIIAAMVVSASANAQSTAKQIKFIDDIQVVPGAYSGENMTAQSNVAHTQTTETATTTTAVNSIEKCSSIQFKYATILDMQVEDITNLKLYNFIDDWMDTRYRYGGTDRNGIDCSAFADTLLNEVYGVNMPRTAREQYDVCKKVHKDNLQEGDLVFFNTRGGVSHVGIYLGNRYFVHSSIRGVMISSLDEDYYSRKYIGGGRFFN